jgi:CheY-like chemotaxis protein
LPTFSKGQRRFARGWTVFSSEKLATELLSPGLDDMQRKTDMLSGKRILLVEDERVMRETLRRLFEQDLHAVVEANNGAEALTLFRSGKFDLVVLDFEMPFVKGNELAARIKMVAPAQPILMITAFQHRPSRDNPVNAVLSKPFTSARLRETVAQLLSQPGEGSASRSVENCAIN